MKGTNLWTLAAVTIFAVVCGACGSASFLMKSPESVVKAILKAANEGKHQEAEAYLASSTKVLLAAVGGIKEFAGKETRDGQVHSVEVVKVETRGEGAKVY